ncbi:MAG: copper resistance protein NlpE N-terminal domain-containing protein [Caldilineaceae bacterium]|nr:copper resistance protein NlpE N-terminal domain-containing protein [Caldilineaceae bacterium]
MTLLRRVPTLLLALVLALAVGTGPAPLMAASPVAPVIQESEPAIIGSYRSNVIPGDANTPDMVAELILYDDGSAEVVSYVEDEAVITEIGTWVEGDDGTMTLTVTASTVETYEQPATLIFDVADDGTLTSDEAGLTLTPTGEGNDVLGQLPEEALIYQSGVMTRTSGPGLQQLTLALFDDETLTLVSDYMNPGEIVVEIGTYAEDEEGNLLVTLTGQVEDGDGTVTEFDAPLELVFTINDDDSISLVDEGGALFGEQGLTLAFVQPGFTATEDAAAEATATEEATAEVEATAEPTVEATEEVTEEAATEAEATPEPTAEATEEDAAATDETALDAAAAGLDATGVVTPSGAYVSDLLPAEDEASSFLVSIFYDDGTAHISTYTLDGTPPVMEDGIWADNLDGSYVLTATGTLDEAYDEPVEIEFTIDEEGIISLSGVPLYPLEDIDLSAAPSVFAEFQSDLITDTTDVTHTITLTLYDDDNLSAEMVTEYTEDGELYNEYGTWDVNADEQLVVTLTADDEADYDEPVEWLFDISDEGVLTLANDDEAYYGETGLTLLPVVIDEQSLEDEVTEENTEAEAASTDDTTSEADTAAAENIQVFQSEVLPAASSPGLQLTLGLSDDGGAALDYDYLNDEEVVTNLGEWVDNEDGTITITFTEGPTGTFEVPVEMTLELGEDGNLTIIDASEESLALLDVVLAPIVLE